MVMYTKFNAFYNLFFNKKRQKKGICCAARMLGVCVLVISKNYNNNKCLNKNRKQKGK